MNDSMTYISGVANFWWNKLYLDILWDFL